jgi:hypothetical protein
MSLLETILEVPLKIVDNVFDKGFFPLVIIAILGALIYYVGFV